MFNFYFFVEKQIKNVLEIWKLYFILNFYILVAALCIIP